MGLRSVEPLINLLPEVEPPKVKPVIKKRLMWTAFALFVFSIMTVITPIGTAPVEQSGFLEQL